MEENLLLTYHSSCFMKLCRGAVAAPLACREKTCHCESCQRQLEAISGKVLNFEGAGKGKGEARRGVPRSHGGRSGEANKSEDGEFRSFAISYVEWSRFSFLGPFVLLT